MIYIRTAIYGIILSKFTIPDMPYLYFTKFNIIYY